LIEFSGSEPWGTRWDASSLEFADRSENLALGVADDHVQPHFLEVEGTDREGVCSTMIGRGDSE
jgi:hypothetical protein